MIILTRMTLAALVFLLVSSAGYAQEKPASPQPVTGEVEALRQRLQAQEAQLERLRQDLQRQSEMIEKQQEALQTLEAQQGRPAVPATPIPVVRTAEAKKPAPGIESDNERIKFKGLLQAWYAAGNEGFRDTFRIRRAELKFIGEITPQIRWTVMLDPAKALSVNQTFLMVDGKKVVADASPNQASRILQEAFITLGYSKRGSLNIGEFKVPIGMENLQSSGALDTVERALFITDRARGAYGDGRDLGVMIYGPLGKSVDYQLGLFNGSGESQNDIDKNDQKAVAAHLVVRPPFVKGLQVGASGAWSGNGSRVDRPRRDRFGAELLFVRDAFRFKSEFLASSDADVHRFGYYAHLGYRVAPQVEAVFRLDSFDPNTRLEINSANVTERDYVAGFNYIIRENSLKLQANYLRKTYANGIVPSGNMFLINLQTSW